MTGIASVLIFEGFCVILYSTIDLQRFAGTIYKIKVACGMVVEGGKNQTHYQIVTAFPVN